MDVHLLLNMWVCLKKWYPKIPVACYHCQYENAISSWYSGWWFQPLWKIWESVGMMKFPLYVKWFKIPWFRLPPTRYIIYIYTVSYTIVMFQSPPTSHKFAGIFEGTSSHPARLAPHRRTQTRWDSEPPRKLRSDPLVALGPNHRKNTIQNPYDWVLIQYYIHSKIEPIK